MPLGQARLCGRDIRDGPKVGSRKTSMKKCPVGLPRYLSCSALQNAISELDNEVDMSRQQKD